MNQFDVCIASTIANRSDDCSVCAYARPGAIPVRFREARM